MATKKDYYDTLGVAKNASDDDIKKAYRKLAMKHHPDRNQGDSAKAAEEKVKEAKEAYEMLSDEQKRAAYDQYGHAGVDPNRGGGPGAEGFGGFAEAFGTRAAAAIRVDAGMAILVVSRAFLLIRKHLVSLFGLLESFFRGFGVVTLVAVRVVLHR